MGNWWYSIKLGFRALFTDTGQYLTNPVAAVEKIYSDDMTAAGVDTSTQEQALKDFEETGGVVTDVAKLYGSATGAIGGAAKSVSGILDFIGKNFTIVLLVIIAGVVAFYVFMFKRQ